MGAQEKATPAAEVIEQMFRSSNSVPVERIALTRELWDRLKSEAKIHTAAPGVKS